MYRILQAMCPETYNISIITRHQICLEGSTYLGSTYLDSTYLGSTYLGGTHLCGT
jgi:hypothetical protein